jgi:hypothetical protein
MGGMLAVPSTRRYPRGLEPVGSEAKRQDSYQWRTLNDIVNHNSVYLPIGPTRPDRGTIIEILRRSRGSAPEDGTEIGGAEGVIACSCRRRSPVDEVAVLTERRRRP